MAKNPHGQFEWLRRRRLIYATLAYCAATATALLVAALRGMEGTLLNTLAVSAYSLAGSMLGSYIFGATWDDKNARDAGMAKLDPVTEPPGATGEPPEDFAG